MLSPPTIENFQLCSVHNTESVIDQIEQCCASADEYSYKWTDLFEILCSRCSIVCLKCKKMDTFDGSLLCNLCENPTEKIVNITNRVKMIKHIEQATADFGYDYDILEKLYECKDAEYDSDWIDDQESSSDSEPDTEDEKTHEEFNSVFRTPEEIYTRHLAIRKRKRDKQPEKFERRDAKKQRNDERKMRVLFDILERENKVKEKKVHATPTPLLKCNLSGCATCVIHK